MSRTKFPLARTGLGLRGSHDDQLRRFGAIRTALIGYGVVAFGYLFARPDAGPDDGTSGLAFIAVGIGLQLALLAAGVFVRRHAPDGAAAARAMFVLELVADGVTVLLFALATLRAVMPPATL
jgi:hypothetical protein